MPDYSFDILSLQDAKYRMTEAKRRIKSEEEHAARKAAQIRIAERSQEVEHAFAKELALANAKGIPQSVLRSEVLRTNAWDRWVYWRDLAEIEPERVVVKAAKQAAKIASRGYRFEDGALILTTNNEGETIPEIRISDLKIDYETPTKSVAWFPRDDDAYTIATFGSLIDAQKHATAILIRAIQDGEI